MDHSREEKSLWKSFTFSGSAESPSRRKTLSLPLLCVSVSQAASQRKTKISQKYFSDYELLEYV